MAEDALRAAKPNSEKEKGPIPQKAPMPDFYTKNAAEAMRWALDTTNSIEKATGRLDKSPLREAFTSLETDYLSLRRILSLGDASSPKFAGALERFSDSIDYFSILAEDTKKAHDELRQGGSGWTLPAFAVGAVALQAITKRGAIIGEAERLGVVLRKVRGSVAKPALRASANRMRAVAPELMEKGNEAAASLLASGKTAQAANMFASMGEYRKAGKIYEQMYKDSFAEGFKMLRAYSSSGLDTFRRNYLMFAARMYRKVPGMERRAGDLFLASGNQHFALVQYRKAKAFDAIAEIYLKMPSSGAAAVNFEKAGMKREAKNAWKGHAMELEKLKKEHGYTLQLTYEDISMAYRKAGIKISPEELAKRRR
jgi:hypothetical protein